MLHWTPARTAASTITPIGAMLAPVGRSVRPLGVMRSDHARMLEHAATRRRAASGQDRDYWIACAPAAVARAAAIRCAAGFSRLP